MDRNMVLGEVQEIFRDVLDDDDISISYESTADDIEDWDSLSHIQLVVAVEKHFEIKFTTTEIHGMKNVGDMCDLVINKAGN